MNKAFTGNSKLTSLLALSAGAVALPQVGKAAVIYSGAINAQVGFSAGYGMSYTLDLPGTAELQLIRGLNFGPYNSGSARVDLRQNNGYARIRAYPTAGGTFARRNNAGATWDSIPGNTNATGRIGWIEFFLPDGSSVRGPGSFNDKYIAFKFHDSDAGDADRYGWARMDMLESASPDPVGPDVVLKDWAYEDSGLKIEMGEGQLVPESKSAAALAMSALALGAVCRWRRAKRRG